MPGWAPRDTPEREAANKFIEAAIPYAIKRYTRTLETILNEDVHGLSLGKGFEGYNPQTVALFTTIDDVSDKVRKTLNSISGDGALLDLLDALSPGVDAAMTNLLTGLVIGIRCPELSTKIAEGMYDTAAGQTADATARVMQQVYEQVNDVAPV